ncbi:MAG: hypothetical protein PVF19_09425 [Gemmatimonadota bacterium]
MSDEQKDSRLPPPAFPPGSRRHVYNNNDRASDDAEGATGSEADAFISPDDPIPPRKDKVDQAFISPDDPLPTRDPDAVFDAFISPDDPLPPRVQLEPEEGIVTGMGDDPHRDPDELSAGGDPHVLEVAGAVERLAAALKKKGEAGLRATPRMTRFEATLRSYCVGYIAGRRAEDEADQRDYESFEGIDIEG